MADIHSDRTQATWRGPRRDATDRGHTLPGRGGPVPLESFTRSEVFAGRLEFGDVLGEGAMGTVVAARDIASGEMRAVKFLSTNETPEALARFKRECAVLERMRDPHVVRIFEVGTADGIPYIVMELLAGGTLRRHIDAAGRLSPQDATRLMLHILRGLAALHKEGIVHRDLKPENVLLTDSGEAKLSDLGVARVFGTAESLTETGGLVGTPRYVSPEQARGEKCTSSTDIYAAGLVLYEMLCGHPPFEMNELYALLHAHIEEPPPELLKEAPATPEALAGLVHRALAKWPEERPGSADEFAKALRRIDGAPASRPVPVPKAPVPAPPPSLKQAVAAVVVVAAGILVLVNLALLRLRVPAPPDAHGYAAHVADAATDAQRTMNACKAAQDPGQRIRLLSDWCAKYPGAYNFAISNELRHELGAVDPHASLQQCDVILEHEPMHGYIMSILAGWADPAKDAAAAVANLKRSIEVGSDLPHLKRDCEKRIAQIEAKRGR